MAAVATTLPSELLFHHAQRSFLELQDFGDSPVTKHFESFLQAYQPALAKSMGLPVTQNATLNVRLNPYCSAHTRLLVNIGSPGWYEALCSDLGVIALTNRVGVPLKELTNAAIFATDSVFATYAKPLTLPVESRFKPLEAPLQYSVMRHDLSKQWFESALYAMAYAIGDMIHTNVPNVVDPQNLKAMPDDIAWQYVTSLAANKKTMQQLFDKTLANLEPIGQDVTVASPARNEMMAYVYKTFIQTLTKNEANLRYAFLKEAIPLINLKLDSLMLAAIAAGPPVATEVAKVDAPTLSNGQMDLFSEEAPTIASLENTRAELPLAVDQINGMSIEALKDFKAKAKAKASAIKAKVSKKIQKAKVKSAEEKARRTAIKNKFAGQKASVKTAEKNALKEDKAKLKAERRDARLAMEKTKLNVIEEREERQMRELAERKKAKKLKPAAPRDEPVPVPPATNQSMVHEEHPLGTFIGNLILAEIDPNVSLRLMTNIACHLCKRKETTTMTTTTTTTTTHTVQETCPKCHKKECVCTAAKKDTKKAAEPEASLLVVVTTVDEEKEKEKDNTKKPSSSASPATPAKVPVSKPNLPPSAPNRPAPVVTTPSSPPAPAAAGQMPTMTLISAMPTMSPVKAKTVAAELPTMPTMSAVQTLLTSNTTAAPAPVSTKLDELAKYANTHALAMKYLKSLAPNYLTAGEYYLYSDKHLGENVSMAGVKGSITSAPMMTGSKNPIKASLQLQHFGADCVFHIMN